MIHPTALSGAHMECRSFDETIPVMTDLLGFEVIERLTDQVTLKHPNTNWALTIHEGEGFDDRPTHHHFGVRVEAKKEVDAAWAYLNTHGDEFGLLRLIPQVNRHGAYSIHFQEPGTNYWEIETYEDVLRKEAGAERLGAVRSRHWTTPLDESRFPGRGYIPQAFTHGTLGCSDADRYGAFVKEVLGLEVHRAYAGVRYLKHSATKHYIVALQVEKSNTFSPSFRFTLSLENAAAVAGAHQWMTAAPADLGLAEVRPLVETGAGASFLLKDIEGNWWELASR